MRDYGKVHSTYWSSGTIAALTDDGKLLSLYLMTCGHGTIAGVFRLPDGYIAEDLGGSWTAERVANGFAELAAAGFAHRCQSSKWVWIVKHLEWNRPENPNQRKAAAKIALSVPESCAWRNDFFRRSGPLVDILPAPVTVTETVDETVDEGSGKGFDNPVGTVFHLFANQKQEQKQEQEQKQDEEPSASSAAKLPTCPHQEILNAFAEQLPMLPQPKPELWGGARAKHLTARWRWLLTATKKNKERYAATSAEGVDWFKRFFGYVAGSDFLTGRDGKWTGCDLGWLLNEENFVKVVQGNYENKAAA
jgi:hypothetical protein